MDAIYRGTCEKNKEYYTYLRTSFCATQCPAQIIAKEKDILTYIKIVEIAYHDMNNKEDEIERFICCLGALQISFSYLIVGSPRKVELYIGTKPDAIENIVQFLWAALPDLKFERSSKGQIERYTTRDIVKADFSYGGLIKGIPQKQEKRTKNLFDCVVSGMRGKHFMVAANCIPIKKDDLLIEMMKWHHVYDDAAQYGESHVGYESGNVNVSISKSNTDIRLLAEYANTMLDRYDDMLSVGGWSVFYRYLATNERDKCGLAGILLSSLYNSESNFEPIHTINCNHDVLDSSAFLLNENQSGPQMASFVKDDFPYISFFRGIYSSNELSRYISFPFEDCFEVHIKEAAQFDVSGREKGNLSLGKILFHSSDSENEYSFDYHELTRHCFVSGLTGGGKTNTIKSILCGIHNANPSIHTLLIEPAKKEYWELYKLGFDNLRIHSVGQTDNSFRINVFERVGNMPIQTHIDYVLAAFKASFIMYTPMPYVLERAVYAIYEDAGWDVYNDTSLYSDVYPTIENLYDKIPVVVKEMGYQEKNQQDIIGALQARVNSMRIGAKGEILNVKRSFSIEELLENDSIIELEDIADDEIKAFIISMILISVMEYRLQKPDSHNQLKHILLIEEAHRLLKNVGAGTGENADPRGNAVEFFCNMLAELRSKGQGFIIADQIPSKLAPDIIKNTNVKIAHRLVDGEERRLIGESMHMTFQQIENISVFEQGVAAVYSEGDYRPKLVKIHDSGVYMLLDRINDTREAVLLKTRKENADEIINQCKLSGICARCRCNCNGGKSELLLTQDIQDIINKVNEEYSKSLQKEYDKKYFAGVLKALRELGYDSDIELNCVMHEIVKKLGMTEKEEELFVTEYYLAKLNNHS